MVFYLSFWIKEKSVATLAKPNKYEYKRKIPSQFSHRITREKRGKQTLARVAASPNTGRVMGKTWTSWKIGAGTGGRVARHGPCQDGWRRKLPDGQHRRLCRLTRAMLVSDADFKYFYDFSLFGTQMGVLDISNRDKRIIHYLAKFERGIRGFFSARRIED